MGGAREADAAGQREVACCSFQTSLAPPEYRKWRRLHGLQRPLHPQQVAGWLTLGAFMAATFLVLVPALGPDLRPSILPILAALFVIHVLSHITALLLDPADAPLRRLKVTTTVPEFDRSKHAHVIENGRCHLCNIRTSGPRTKHCSVCNKCVGRFDHHCKWLNHCVGGRNYIAFLVCVVSAVLAALVVVGVSVAELVLYHVQPQWLSPWTYVPYNRTVANVESDAHFPFQDTVFLIVVGALGVMAAVSAGLLLHLCLFHVYISALGITTYEYIRKYRQLTSAPSAPPPTSKNVLTAPIVRTPSEGRPHSLPRSPNSAEVHSNVGTPQDSSCARHGSTSSSQLLETPSQSGQPCFLRPKTVTFMGTCCRPKEQPRPTPESRLPVRQVSLISEDRYNFSSILKKSKSLNDADLEAARTHSEIAIIQPYTISWDNNSEDPEAEKVVTESLCCASLRSTRSTKTTKTVANGRTRPGTPRSVSDQSLRVSGSGGYLEQDVTEYSGCECNPSRIPVAPPMQRYPMGNRPSHRPRRPISKTQTQSNSSLLRRFCAHFSSPHPRAGVAYPAGVRRNQIRPSAESPQARMMGQAHHPSSKVKMSALKVEDPVKYSKLRRSSSADNKKYSTLPALQPPKRRRQTVSLKELGDVLAFVQNPAPAPTQQPSQQQKLQKQHLKVQKQQLVQQHQQRRHPSDPVRRAALTRQGRRRSSTPQPARPRSPTLSPIHESGLSNPPTPQRPRTKQTPDSESPPRDIIDSDPELDDENHSIIYIDEDDGTYFTASMSSTPSTPMTPMTPLTPLSVGFSAATWASRDRHTAASPTRAPASAL